MSNRSSAPCSLDAVWYVALPIPLCSKTKYRIVHVTFLVLTIFPSTVSGSNSQFSLDAICTFFISLVFKTFFYFIVRCTMVLGQGSRPTMLIGLTLLTHASLHSYSLPFITWRLPAGKGAMIQSMYPFMDMETWTVACTPTTNTWSHCISMD